MRKPSRLRLALQRACAIALWLMGLLWLLSMFVEIRYVTNTPWTGPIASFERGTFYYAEWGKPLPGTGDRWLPWDGVKGLSFHTAGLLAPPEPPLPPYPSVPRMIHLSGQARVVKRESAFIPFAVVLALYFILARRPRPHPPGHCAECGYDLTGNTSGICSECGEPKAPPAIR